MVFLVELRLVGVQLPACQAPGRSWLADGEKSLAQLQCLVLPRCLSSLNGSAPRAHGELVITKCGPCHLCMRRLLGADMAPLSQGSHVLLTATFKRCMLSALRQSTRLLTRTPALAASPFSSTSVAFADANPLAQGLEAMVRC